MSLDFSTLRYQNPNFISLSSSKSSTFFAPKRLEPLSVNGFRLNQPAIINPHRFKAYPFKEKKEIIFPFIQFRYGFPGGNYPLSINEQP